ncbi:hypothetical protein DEO72_LG1g2070 [Vigna unguiculata]|uniref:Uncharacterized protein n=1 Tax=Vigna unguiculata TaxID=3917 RepID=A0A4D6KRU3_VIGUN|nr:hypothetical protein DEO72_LG1g2070 [Vigna unguiculata]
MEAEFVENYDQHRVSSEDATKRFVKIMSRSLIPERKVKLNPGEYDEFRLELERRNWHQVLGDLPNEIDETLVKEFYANTYQQVRTGPRQAKETPYSAFMSGQKDFDEIASILCLPGHAFVLGVNGTPVRLLRKHLTSLAQMWSDIAYTADAANVNLGFLTIITALCMEKGLVSDAHVLLSLAPPLDRKFFHKNCTNRAIDAPAPAPARQPRDGLAPTASHVVPNLFRLILRRLFRPPWPRCSPEKMIYGTQFEEYIPWPEGRPASQWGVMCLMMMRKSRSRSRKRSSRKNNNNNSLRNLIHYGFNNRKSSRSLHGVVGFCFVM